MTGLRTPMEASELLLVSVGSHVWEPGRSRLQPWAMDRDLRLQEVLLRNSVVPAAEAA